MCKKMAAVLLVMLIGLFAGNASAMMGGEKGRMDCKGKGCGEKGRMMKGEGMAGRFKMMVEMLDLNADQRKAVETIYFAHHKEVIRKEADLDVAEVELQEIMNQDPVKVEDAEKKIRAISDLRADLEIMHLKAKEAIKAKLTPEQLEKMKKHMAADMEEKMEDMGGMRGMTMKGCKMGGRSKKAAMMKGATDDMKASGADSAGHDDKADEKMEHPHHH